MYIAESYGNLIYDLKKHQQVNDIVLDNKVHVWVHVQMNLNGPKPIQDFNEVFG